MIELSEKKIKEIHQLLDTMIIIHHYPSDEYCRCDRDVGHVCEMCHTASSLREIKRMLPKGDEDDC